MHVVWSTAALTDLSHIRDYLAAENPFAAREVAKAIVEAGDALARFPLRGHIGESGTREWVVTRYPRYLLIYYVDQPNEVVTVLRVWHQARER